MELTRRKFLQLAGSLTGAAAIGAVALPREASATEEFPGYPNRYGLLTDTTLCIGCRMCENACAQAHNLPAPQVGPQVLEKTRRTDAKSFTVVNRYPNPKNDKVPIYRKIQCFHCNEPACVSACLVGALKKTPEGPVIYNEDVCIGCRYCMNACPYSMPTYEYDDPITPAIQKCIMCYERVVQPGGVPACASICPLKATIFGKRSDLLRIAHERINKTPERYVDHVYGEKEVGGTGWLYLASVPFDQLGLPTDLGTTPYPEYTRDFLLGVPLVLTMWPALFMGVSAISKERDKAGQRTSDDHTEVSTDDRTEVTR